jgi:2-polyprenyl-3-methyl-5-hydroxy-6-metoxy-1,4-benzoquinol methylase
MTNNEGIGIEDKPRCYICNGAGAKLYGGLRDRLFNAPGAWNILSCRHCGLIWLDPQPVPNEMFKIYGNYYTHQTTPSGSPPPLKMASQKANLGRAVLSEYYGYRQSDANVTVGVLWKSLCGLSGVRDIFSFQIMGLKAAWRGRLLDVGCGDGAFLARMKSLGWEAVGVELDEKAANVAKTQFDVDVFIGTLEAAGFADESFDAITLSHVIEHVGDPIELLCRCRNLLRKGGRVVVTTPNADSLGHRIFREHWRGLEVPRHLMVFSLSTLAHLASKAGLSTDALRTSARGAHAFYLESRLLKAGRWMDNPWPRAGKRLKLESAFFQIIEEAAGMIRKSLGEELYFEGIKE